MINNSYAKAYTEVLAIIEHFSKEDYAKIPAEKIEFYKKNMDKNYNFTIDPKVDLDKQNVSKEANAIIVNLFRDYYATEYQKTKIKEILNLNQMREEQEKRKKYNPDDIFKKDDSKGNESPEKTENETTLMVEYTESFFTKFKKFIFKLLHISTE